jgi:hypothetical protein
MTTRNYVRVQSEAALRNAATSYPYDSHEEHIVSLRGSTASVAEHLKKEVQQRLEKAGVEVLEARFSHMAYAQEIAAAMLQRQQAGAIIAARKLIVEGAVGMVEMALEQLSHKGIVHLDEERKAAMVSNLLVVLCGEKAAQPILNTGTFTSKPGPVPERKPFLLRIDAAVLEGVQRWANDDLRSLNAQIEYLLRESLRRAGRAQRAPAQGDTPSESDPSTDT